MSEYFDPEAIIAANPIAEIIGRYVDLRSNGSEFQACCPFHDERTPSFTVNPHTNLFYCFGCGAGGNVINFMMNIANIDFKAACRLLGGKSEDLAKIKASPLKRELRKPEDIYAGFEPVIPAPHEIIGGGSVPILNPKKVDENGFNAGRWKPVNVWPYTQANGQVSHYVIRTEIEKEGGKKEKLTPTVYWCKWPNGGEGWTLYRPEENRPLMNLHKIKSNVNAVIYLVEGEKAAEVGDRETFHLSESIVFSCWPGGTNGIKAVDWKPLAGRKVMLLPDYDLEGFKCLRGQYKGNEKTPGVIDYLKEVHAEIVGFIIPEEDRPKGWDIADKDGKREPAWKQGELVDWMKARKRSKLQKHPLEKTSESEEQKPAGEGDYIDPPDLEECKQHDLSDLPFRILGYSRDTRYYLPMTTQQIIELSPSQHSASQLINLAPLEYWLWKFGDGRKPRSIQWIEVANALLKLSAEKGLFDSKSDVRGRGAWLDNGRAVLHLGEEVYVDGEEHSPEEVDSKFIYEKNHSIGHIFTDPASTEESVQLLNLIKMLSWENPLSAYLLAGWCVIAPICGILKWRPHIWITGASGTGKTTALDMIVKVMLGNFGIKTEGKTTEAGIRQTLGQDARPVIYDEAEAEDKKAAGRMQEILDLARVSSSGGVITKGSQDGEGISFCVRACFCFSAINHSVKHLADENRISQLVLVPNIEHSNKEKFKELKLQIQETITEEFAAKMFARSMANMETLVHNIEVFVDAAAIELNSRRIADQVGTMLAGVYLCQTDKKISPENARKWIAAQDWGDHTTLNSSSDLERLISKIATSRINVRAEHETFNITIGEAIISAAGRAEAGSQLDKMRHECHDELRRHGIKLYEPKATETRIADDGVMIANSSEPLRKLLEDTPWSVSWPRVLFEHDQAQKIETSYFTGGINQRSVMLPVDAFHKGVKK